MTKSRVVSDRWRAEKRNQDFTTECLPAVGGSIVPETSSCRHELSITYVKFLESVCPPLAGP